MSAACLGCGGRCCSAYIVPVTGQDVRRIAEGLRLEPAVFVRREPEDRPSDTGFRMRPGGPTFGLALQHLPVRRNERQCVFLMQLRGGLQRCGIYAHRPLACQTYPMELEQGRAEARSDMMCPAGSWAGLADDPAWRGLLERQDGEWRLYAQVVGRWNAAVEALPAGQGAALEQYLAYLLLAYDQLGLLGVDRDELPAPAAEQLAALAAASLTGG